MHPPAQPDTIRAQGHIHMPCFLLSAICCVCAYVLLTTPQLAENKIDNSPILSLTLPYSIPSLLSPPTPSRPTFPSYTQPIPLLAPATRHHQPSTPPSRKTRHSAPYPGLSPTALPSRLSTRGETALAVLYSCHGDSHS